MKNPFDEYAKKALKNNKRSKKLVLNNLQSGIAETTAAFPLNKAHDFVVTFRL
jgi:hypothetical protein